MNNILTTPFTSNLNHGLEIDQQNRKSNARKNGSFLPFSEEVEQKVSKASKAIFLMGASGAGKGTIRQIVADCHSKREYVVIDMDIIKASMPEYQEAIQQGDTTAASQVHAESAKRSVEQLKQAIQQRRNFIYDSTGSRIFILEEHMQAAKENGMDVEIIYVMTDLENCLKRVRERNVITKRVVPDDVVDSSHFFSKTNFETLLESSNHVDKWKVYDNNGPCPQLIASFSSKKYKKIRNVMNAILD